MGATVAGDGVNFSVLSPRATRVWLRLYRGATDAEPVTEIELDAERNRTFAFWHVLVGGAQPGWFYTWRADGPNEPEEGLRFDASRELLDPWARLVSDATWRPPRPCAASTPRSARRSAPDAPATASDGRCTSRSTSRSSTSCTCAAHAPPWSGVEHPGTPNRRRFTCWAGITRMGSCPSSLSTGRCRPTVPRSDSTASGGYSPFAPFAPHPHYAASADVRNIPRLWRCAQA
jgi:glycogen operon protein